VSRRAPVIVRKLNSWHNVYCREVVLVYGSREAVNRWLVRKLDAEEALKAPIMARWLLWQRGEHVIDYIIVLLRPTP
jgi:hypothetical protein